MNLSWVFFLGIGVWCFPCVAVVFVSFSWITCYLSCLINRDIWRGIFAASSGRLCWIFKCCLVFLLSICWCFVSVLHIVRQFCSFALVEVCLVNTFFLNFPFYSCWLIYNFFYFILAVPVGALGRLVELLNRTLWQR